MLHSALKFYSEKDLEQIRCCRLVWMQQTAGVSKFFGWDNVRKLLPSDLAHEALPSRASAYTLWTIEDR